MSTDQPRTLEQPLIDYCHSLWIQAHDPPPIALPMTHRHRTRPGIEITYTERDRLPYTQLGPPQHHNQSPITHPRRRPRRKRRK